MTVKTLKLKAAQYDQVFLSKDFNDNIHFLKVLESDKRVTKDVDDKTLKDMLDPAKYIGFSVQMVDDVEKAWKDKF